jgi:FkbM family methyltransferase
MMGSVLSFVRNSWHPLRKLRRLTAFRWFQNRFDIIVYRRVPGSRVRMAIKLLRDATWLVMTLEPQVRIAFELVLNAVKPKVFWDVGANLGFYSWLVRQYPSIQEVILFEPDPTNFDLITRTIQKNRVLNCRPMNLALSDARGYAPFLIDRASGATGSLGSVSNVNNALSLQYDYRMGETITSRTATVDGLIADGLPVPDLIKLDVEGAEHLVLAGAATCLSQSRPALILETSNSKLLRRLSEEGYSVFRIDAGNFVCIWAQSEDDLVQFKQVFDFIESKGLPS